MDDIHYSHLLSDCLILYGKIMNEGSKSELL